MGALFAPSAAGTSAILVRTNAPLQAPELEVLVALDVLDALDPEDEPTVVELDPLLDDEPETDDERPDVVLDAEVEIIDEEVASVLAAPLPPTLSAAGNKQVDAPSVHAPSTTSFQDEGLRTQPAKRRTQAPSRRARLVAGAILSLSGCGGGQTHGTPFGSARRDDHGGQMAAVAATITAADVPLGADVAVGVVTDRLLVGVVLDTGSRWTFVHEIEARPSIAGSVVVASGGGEVFALDARTGSLLWARPEAGRVRGIGDDGATTVISFIPVLGVGSRVLAVARDGSVVRQLEDELPIGVPAVVGHTAFLPWRGHFLSAYDLVTGDERARMELADPMSRVLASGRALYAGETSFTRLDGHLAADAHRVSIARASVPVFAAMPWTRPGTDWVTRAATPADNLRLYARPSDGGAARAFAGTLSRAAVGFDARGQLAWAYLGESDFLGGASYENGLALRDARGSIVMLDTTTGGVSGRLSLLERVLSCVVQADGLLTGPALRAGSLPDQIRAIAETRDAELQLLREQLARP